MSLGTTTTRRCSSSTPRTRSSSWTNSAISPGWRRTRGISRRTTWGRPPCSAGPTTLEWCRTTWRGFGPQLLPGTCVSRNSKYPHVQYSFSVERFSIALTIAFKHAKSFAVVARFACVWLGAKWQLSQFPELGLGVSSSKWTLDGDLTQAINKRTRQNSSTRGTHVVSAK